MDVFNVYVSYVRSLDLLAIRGKGSAPKSAEQGCRRPKCQPSEVPFKFGGFRFAFLV